MGAGLAGAMMANAMRFASPDMMHWMKSGELMIMVIPVSYTHLDVYKRQAFGPGETARPFLTH